MYANPTPQRACGDAPPRVAVLIPAFEAGNILEDLVERLVGAGVPAIIVVDDGSRPERQRTFERLARQPEVHLLHHVRNLGKGMALKTGMRYFLEHLPHYTGLVTANAGGQHSAEDVVRVARALHKAPRLAVLGARNFDGTHGPAGLPRWTRMGNRAMVFLFRAFTGIPVTDAQTGLRGLPTTLLPRLLELPGARYEYEMAVLLHIVRSRHPLAEQPIRTLHGESRTSQFRPLADSWRVLVTLLAPPQPGVLKPNGVATAETASDPERTSSSRTMHVK